MIKGYVAASFVGCVLVLGFCVGYKTTLKLTTKITDDVVASIRKRAVI